MRPDCDTILDLSDVAEKRRLMAWLSARSGMYRVRAEPKRDTRSLRQNAAWWRNWVGPLHDYARENYAHHPPNERGRMRCHRALVSALMGDEEYPCPLTGAMSVEPVSTHNMDIETFSDLMERGAVLLAAEKGIVVEDPSHELAAGGAR